MLAGSAGCWMLSAGVLECWVLRFRLLRCSVVVCWELVLETPFGGLYEPGTLSRTSDRVELVIVAFDYSDVSIMAFNAFSGARRNSMLIWIRQILVKKQQENAHGRIKFGCTLLGLSVWCGAGLARVLYH